MSDDKTYVVIGGRTFVIVNENETRCQRTYKLTDLRGG